MSREQIIWTQDKCDNIRGFIIANAPLTDEMWERVADYIAKITELAKSSGAEVRAMLFDTVEDVSREQKN